MLVEFYIKILFLIVFNLIFQLNVSFVLRFRDLL